MELPEAVDGLELFRRAKENKIFIVPGTICTSAGKYRNCIRISCGYPWRGVFEEGFGRLGELARELM